MLARLEGLKVPSPPTSEPPLKLASPAEAIPWSSHTGNPIQLIKMVILAACAGLEQASLFPFTWNRSFPSAGRDAGIR